MTNVNKMDKFYEDANDQHVRAIFVYTDDTYVYADEAKTIKIDRETLKDLYLKNEIVVCRENSFMRPVACNIQATYTEIVVSESIVMYSAEYTA